MNPFFTEQLASQHICEMHASATRAQLIRHATTVNRWTRTCAAVRRWFARTQLGPINNYVTR